MPFISPPLIRRGGGSMGRVQPLPPSLNPKGVRAEPCPMGIGPNPFRVTLKGFGVTLKGLGVNPRVRDLRWGW
jgi:hypothetical protein